MQNSVDKCSFTKHPISLLVFEILTIVSTTSVLENEHNDNRNRDRSAKYQGLSSSVTIEIITTVRFRARGSLLQLLLKVQLLCFSFVRSILQSSFNKNSCHLGFRV